MVTFSRRIVLSLVALAAGACDSDGAAPVKTDGASDRGPVADAESRDGRLRPADTGATADAESRDGRLRPADTGATADATVADAGEDPKHAEFRALAENFCRAVCDCSYIEGIPRDVDCNIGVQGCCTVWSLLGYDSCIEGHLAYLNDLDQWCAQVGNQSCGCDWLEVCKEYSRTVTCDPENPSLLGIPVECFPAAIPVEEQCCTDPLFGRCTKPI